MLSNFFYRSMTHFICLYSSYTHHKLYDCRTRCHRRPVRSSSSNSPTRPCPTSTPRRRFVWAVRAVCSCNSIRHNQQQSSLPVPPSNSQIDPHRRPLRPNRRGETFAYRVTVGPHRPSTCPPTSRESYRCACRASQRMQRRDRR